MSAFAMLGAILCGLIAVASATTKRAAVAEWYHNQQSKEIATGVLFAIIAVVLAYLSGRVA